MRHRWHKYLLLFFLVCLLMACNRGRSKYIIGVSQCSNDEWRVQMNKEILREALFYPGVKVKIRQAQDDNARQINDIKEFIRQRVNLIIVAPNEAGAIAPVLEEAYEAGIPVVLVDRRIHSDKYTAYVGADNYEVGKKVGEYIVNALHGKGKVVEITGLKASTPAIERHRGMMDALKKTSDIKIVASADAGWFQDKARMVVDTILRNHDQIDLIVAQNDRMAMGAYQEARRQKREKEILFIGIDAVAGKGYGVESVAKGELTATFIYPTGGDKVMQVAMAILKGQKYERENYLSTAAVDKGNARIMQLQTEHIFALDHKIELLHNRLDDYFLRYSAQKMFLKTTD